MTTTITPDPMTRTLRYRVQVLEEQVASHDDQIAKMLDIILRQANHTERITQTLIDQARMIHQLVGTTAILSQTVDSDGTVPS